jgi:NAD(P)-dependent dehydrogenase (short-subunit alcohol dehydrogenase family)
MASILITGSGAGIGRETALTLARAGHRVFATMRSPEKSRDVAETAAAEGLPLTIHRLDVDSDESVRDAVAAILASGEAVDVLVNNAGIERAGAIEELPLADFRTCMETNYFGVVRCVQALLPHMRARRSGTIVNISSVSGRIAAAPLAPYVASKFALEAFSECLAQEVKAFDIRVAIVEPGIIDTRMARSITVTGSSSDYPHRRRFAALFRAALSLGPSPAIVAARIREIIESGTWQFRHPAGPDAAPFLDWRAALSDETWIDFGAQTDAEWVAQVARDFGMPITLADLDPPA